MLEENALLKLYFRHWVGNIILVLLYLLSISFACCLLYSFFVVVVIDVYAIRIDKQCAPLVRSVDSP